MSMAEPLLPHPRSDSESTPAAEPGNAGPSPAHPEEPDILPGPAEPEDARPLPDPPFRTPTPGDRLHPDELAAELGEDDQH